MELIRHHGVTIERDFILSVSFGGGYIAVGRYDVGVNFRFRDWSRLWYDGGGGLLRVKFGPFDFMRNDK